MRITQRMLMNDAVERLGTTLLGLAKAQERASTGKRLNHPDDDPIGVEQALGLRSNLETLDAHLQTISASRGWLAATEHGLQALADLLTETRNLALRGASDHLTVSDRVKLADQADQNVDQALQTANSRYGNDYLFAGLRVTTLPFVLAPAPALVSYQGDTGLMQREVEPGGTLSVNVSGDQIQSALVQIITVRDALRAGDGATLAAALSTIDDAIEELTSRLAEVGAKTSRLDETQSRLESLQTNLKSRLSNIEDQNMAEAAIEVASRDTIYRATLSATSRIIQPTSLFDYLR